MEKYLYKICSTVLLTIICLIPSSSFATDYFVHANIGNNSNSGLQPDDAFADLTYAMMQLQPDDTLYVRSGIYSTIPKLVSTYYNSGTATSPITVKPYLNEVPIISTGTEFRIWDVSWWVFDGLVFEASKRVIIGARNVNIVPTNAQCKDAIAENIVFRSVKFRHGSDHGIFVECTRHLLIENSTFDNLRSRISGVDNYAISFRHYADDVRISGNHFRDIGADAIQFNDSDGGQYTNIDVTNNEIEIAHPYRYRDETGSIIATNIQPFDSVGETGITIKMGPGPITISGNLIHGYRPTLPGQDASGAMGVAVSILYEGRGVTLSSNTFYDNVVHLFVQEGLNYNPGTGVLPVRDTVIRNNIFEESVFPTGIYANSPQRSVALDIGSVNNVKVINNTFHNSDAYSPDGTQKQLLVLDNSDNIELENNAFHNGRVSMRSLGNANLLADFNAWSAVTGVTDDKFIGLEGSAVSGQNDLITDSLGIDWSTMKPLLDSPVIDAGTDSGITNDFYGLPVSGLGIDIGAVEYQQSAQAVDNQNSTIAISNSIDAGGSNGGGCSINPNSKLDLIWLLLMLIPAAGLICKRLR